jgi:hypothetical protein
MKMLKFALITIVVLIITSIAALFINYYFYSWTSFINPFGCSCKEIAPKETMLEQEYDLIKIGESTKLDTRYNTAYRSSRFSTSRSFADVKYTIRIDYRPPSTGNYYEVYFSNGNTSELKTTPNAYIRRNINQMIDEMPLNDEQKTELKSKVRIDCRSTWGLFF